MSKHSSRLDLVLEEGGPACTDCTEEQLPGASTDGQYSRSYYRATYINTALDAGFSTAMSIRPKWLRDISSLLFAGYYLIYSNEADEVVSRRYLSTPDTNSFANTVPFAVWRCSEQPGRRRSSTPM